jgi:hypothetical protein
VTTKRALAIGLPIWIAFLSILWVLPIPIWTALLAFLTGVAFWWTYRWKTGIREQTLEALARARSDRTAKRAGRGNGRHTDG